MKRISSQLHRAFPVVPFLAAAGLAIVTPGSARADYASTVLGLNPIGYYRLNETTLPPADTAANLGSAGTLGTGFYINNPYHEAPGALAGSTDPGVGLNGTSQRVATPYDTLLNPTGPFTAEAWVSPSANATAATPLCPLSYWSQPSGRTGWLIYQWDSGWNLRMYNGVNTTQSVDLSGGGPPVVGAWYHLVVRYDGANAAFYVNGVKAGEVAVSAYAPNAGGPFSIGARADGAFWFPGYADEVALYAHALTEGQILAHYQNGTNASPSQPYNSLVLAGNPLLYYRLNEPTFTGGTPVTAVNAGNLGAMADGAYEPGALNNVAGPQFGGFGPANTALRLSTLAGHVSIPPQSLVTDRFTITCWFKRSGARFAGQALVFQRRQSDQALATGLGFGYNGSPGVDQLNVHWNEGPSSWLTGLTPPNDVWCFGAAVYTPTNVTVYLNGASSSLNTALGTHDFGIASIYLGWDFPFTRFSGSLDEVALFDRALSPAEVQGLFAASQMPPQLLSLTRTPADPVFEGYSVAFTATVAGVPPLAYQWFKGGLPMSGKTTSVLAFPNAALGDSGDYTLVVTNLYGAATSAVQTLLIQRGPPLLLSQSIANATRAVGGWVTYSVVVGGSPTLSYQWKRGGNPIPGATTSVLALRNLQLADAGIYNVTITNPYGTTNSASGTVTVFGVTNYPFAALYGNPLAYYRLNEASGTTAFDYAGGLNGSILSSMVLGAAGPRPPNWAGLEATNTAFGFNGSSTRVQLPSFNLKTNQLTIAAWIKPAGAQHDQTGILASRSPSGLGGLFVNLNNNNALSYVWEGTDSWWQFQSGLVPVIGQWNFVALVIEPNQGTVYLEDGAGLRSAVYTPSQGNRTVIWDSPNIGVDLGYNRWFNGAIDEVVVYDRALGLAEVANLALLGQAGPVAPRLWRQPLSQTVFAGQSAAFDTVALGALPLLYQWQRGGVDLPGATQTALVVPDAYFSDAGDYRVRVSNAIGASNSQPATLTVLAQPEFANLTNDLLLHLEFEGDYQDSSGLGHHAYAISGNPSFLAGKIGQGVHMDTAPNQNYLLIDDSANDFMFDETVSFTVAFWLKYTDPFNDVPIIGNAYNSTWQIGWVFTDSATPGKLEWSLASTPNTGTYLRDPVPGCPTINDGAWHHVVGVVDRTRAITAVYVDGLLASSWSIAGLGSLASGWWPAIGSDPSGAYSGRANFDLDDVGIWRRALSSTEAGSIYLVGHNYGRSFDTYGPVTVTIKHAGSEVELIWQAGTLEWADEASGGWSDVPGAAAPYHRLTPGAAKKFFRVRL